MAEKSASIEIKMLINSYHLKNFTMYLRSKDWLKEQTCRPKDCWTKKLKKVCQLPKELDKLMQRNTELSYFSRLCLAIKYNRTCKYKCWIDLVKKIAVTERRPELTVVRTNDDLLDWCMSEIEKTAITSTD
jgi:hypothetical protein